MGLIIKEALANDLQLSCVAERLLVLAKSFRAWVEYGQIKDMEELQTDTINFLDLLENEAMNFFEKDRPPQKQGPETLTLM